MKIRRLFVYGMWGLALMMSTAVPCVAGENYFPLQVGNRWEYQTIPADPAYAITRAITDSIVIGGRTYYIWNGMTVRRDEAGSVWEYREEGDVCWFDFTSDRDTTYQIPVGMDAYTDAYTVNRTVVTVVNTPLRSFENCLEFHFFFPGVMDSDRIYRFADGIGPVTTHDAMNSYEITGAVVNGVIWTGVDHQDRVPSAFTVDPIYPNPFNGSTRLTVSMPAAGRVDIQAFDMKGRCIGVVFRGFLDAGHHTLTWNPAGLPSGNYILRLSSRGIHRSIICTYQK